MKKNNIKSCLFFLPLIIFISFLNACKKEDISAPEKGSIVYYKTFDEIDLKLTIIDDNLRDDSMSIKLSENYTVLDKYNYYNKEQDWQYFNLRFSHRDNRKEVFNMFGVIKIDPRDVLINYTRGTISY